MREELILDCGGMTSHAIDLDTVLLIVKLNAVFLAPFDGKLL
jgi:hypothetical protein